MTTDGPNAHGVALLDLAVVLAGRGDLDAAVDAATSASSLFAAKKSRVAEQRAPALARTLSPR
jgi:hypothetical protein